MRWTVSVVATAASTYALDLFAAAAGALVVASGVLGGLSHSWVVAVLVASYLVWALGLRTNLRANGALLAATGTSTNVLSKAAYDLTRRFTRRAGAPRVAAAVAYAGTEVVKELPYYAAAFGAAAATSAITTTDALVFLAGANLGAAVYEYGLGRLTAGFLRRRFASFETDWQPRRYLTDYYSAVEPDELATITYLVAALREAERDRPILFFGVGPTLHHVFAAAEVASEIHLGDYLPANLTELQRWVDRAPDAHDWRPFVRYTLRCEGISDPTDAEVTLREDLTRKKITELIVLDARSEHPTDVVYSTVVSPYCADSATDNLSTWRELMRNITGLVEPGGLFITAALHRCTFYSVGGRRFPSANIGSEDLRAALEPDFDCAIEVCSTGQETAHGYGSVLLAHARRRELSHAQSR
ncbi:NNMT/PNMT/TEMT family protein [Asanoa hainanensis]|uniref:NNMT/PNMT/TEMT family protein n=1 Tax=Asanoa hainanensis TaxID=560556 RepID=A0A239MIG7_9ACTN|nr:guanitoxin biosynthesis pre-guanitoxin forming N-methyltransferase GntF [Asanoa hainanensis]SNT41748.1 NNMT/PNMT/TEMT family protein [Asanoa hainanensis]